MTSLMQLMFALSVGENGRVVVPSERATQCCGGSVGCARWCVYCWTAFPQSTPPLPVLVFEKSWDVP